MATNTEVGIVKVPVVADPSEIIPAALTAVDTAVDISLKPAPFVPPPTPPAPIPPDLIPPVVPPSPPEKNRLILNIETSGYRPWEHRIISIGLQDPMVPNSNPTTIMLADEAQMINALFTIIKEAGYNELVGYGLAFDYRFLLIKAMKYGINCKEFYDMTLYDLMQAAAQGKFSFVYKAQQPPSLSDLADYLWGYPKPFTDLEMIKYWAQGQFDKVVEFTSSQVTRILALYLLFRNVSETPYIATFSGIIGPSSKGEFTPRSSTVSKLTIPEANLPEIVRLRCPDCLAEAEFKAGTTTATCTICNGEMKPI